MRGRPLARASLLITATVWPSVAWAHPDGADAGFMKGLFHPVFGADHLLAMVCVGVVSAQLGGKHLLRIPAIFLLGMTIGGLAGMLRVSVPMGELGIALSVVLLGLSIVTAGKSASPALIAGFVVFFGSLHGHAHGLEMPRSTSPALYVLGFLLSTTMLHLLGLVVGEVARERASWLTGLRYAGALVSGMGVLIGLRGAGLF
jgi:urease accessory protein